MVTFFLSRLEPAAPSVDRSLVFVGTVERGQMLREVRGNGTLVPEEVQWIPTVNPARVAKILVLPGAVVKADTVLVELTNPEVEQAAFDAEWALRGAESDLANLRVQLQALALNQQAAVASAHASYSNARLEFEANEQLAKDGLVPQIVLKQSRARSEELAKLLEIEQERLKIQAEATRAQQIAQEARVEQARALLALKRQHAEALKIRAGFDGVLQKLGDASTLQVGQQLHAGASVARVANPARLKAEIRIYETQAKDILPGQRATIKTLSGDLIPGRVARVDPAVLNGTVLVDVALEGPLPKGARTDLGVDGTIELDRLDNTLHMGKPVNATADGPVSLFRLLPNGREARRVTVRLGRSSVNEVEVLEGLQEGDQVVLSDTAVPPWSSHDRVRLN